MSLLRLALVATLVLVFGIAALYAYRATGPGVSQPAGVLLTVIPVLGFASGLLLLGALALGRRGSKTVSTTRVDALMKLAELRDFR